MPQSSDPNRTSPRFRVRRDKKPNTKFVVIQFRVCVVVGLSTCENICQDQSEEWILGQDVTRGDRHEGGSWNIVSLYFGLGLEAS